MPIYSKGILMKPEGFKLYGSRGLIYETGGGGPVLSDGSITTTEVTDTTALGSGGFNDLDYSGGYLFESSNGTGPWVCCLAFGGQGTMGGGNPRSDILAEGIGEGLDLYDDWVIDGGNKRLAVFQMYYPITTVYPLNANGINAVHNAIAWMKAHYGVSKVYILASSQGGNVLRWLADDAGGTGLTDPAYCRANLLGAYHGAAELPTTGPDLTGMTIEVVIGQNDGSVSSAQQTSRASSINAASTGSPATVDVIPGGAHFPYWDEPFNVGRSDVDASDEYDGLLTWLNILE